jgi:radical SAM-linked protein
MSILEAAFSRGDARLSALIERAWSLGCRLDGWSEVFNFKTWLEAMDQTGIDASTFATKSYNFSDILPWEIIDIGVTKDFLWKEYQNALAGEVTVDCRKVCHNCGLNCKKVNEEIPAFHNTTGCIPAEPISSEKVRVEFSKTGNLRYLSHRELMSTIHRSLRRAGFPLIYSKGFHPSPKISYGPPLGVGIAGMGEYFDIEVLSPFDSVLNKRNLNKSLPEGIYIKEMSVIPLKTEALQSFIKRYEYEIQGGDISSVHRFLSKNEVYRDRENQTVNLRDMVQEIQYSDDNTVTIFLIDTNDCKVRLGEILPVVFGVPLEELIVTRVALYGWDAGWIKPMERSLQWTAKY